MLPWSDIAASDDPIGELWFRRADANSPKSVLLLKLLFTTEPLSIQVHPDDTFARSIGLANGKTEAWYILSAAPSARVAIGLKRSLSSTELRTAILDGSIVDLVQWRPVRCGDAIFVPAGTASFLPKSSSTATPRSAFSTTDGSVSCIPNMPLPLPRRRQHRVNRLREN